MPAPDAQPPCPAGGRSTGPTDGSARRDRRAGPQRHDLVQISPAAWEAMLAATPGIGDLAPEARDLLRDWARRGWPAILRRRSAGDAADALPLGVPLPPALGKLRIGLALASGTAWTPAAGPDLAAASSAAPVDWRDTIDALVALGRACAAPPRPFGALLWGALTGLPYLAPGSDLDLLWPARPGTDLDGLLAGLERIDALGTSPRLDGEILLADGAGLQWREFARARRTPGGEVLAKTLDGLSLRPAASPLAVRSPP